MPHERVRPVGYSIFLRLSSGSVAALPIAEVVNEGGFTAAFVQSAREGSYPVGEGVICKGWTAPLCTASGWGGSRHSITPMS